MFIKLLGALIIISSSTLFGITYKYRYVSLIKELENLLVILENIKNGIRISYDNVTVSVEKSMQCASEQNAIMLESFLNSIEKNSGIVLSEIWTRSLYDIQDEIIYSKKDIEIISEFGNLLGAGDVETQTSNINNIEAKINDSINFYKSRNEKYDISSKLGVYAGVVIVVVLI